MRSRIRLPSLGPIVNQMVSAFCRAAGSLGCGNFVVSGRMRLPAVLGLLMLMLPLTGTIAASAADPPPAGPTLRVFVPPPLEWNHRTMTARSGLSQTPYDLARVNGNLTFGMTPEQVAATLPGLPSGLTWNSLRAAREYSSDVRYFWVRLDDLPEWRDRLGGCVGNGSYAAFLFTELGLFRLSFRLMPDTACASVTKAALDLFARYVPIGPDIALSVHYLSAPAEVVDITDPTATQLAPVRWRMSGT
jgi:hypothetical protein